MSRTGWLAGAIVGWLAISNCGYVPSARNPGDAASGLRSPLPTPPRPSPSACQERPTARQYMAFVYMPDRNSALLFGGQEASGRRLNDTWSLSAGCWSKLTPPNSPPVLSNMTAAYDIDHKSGIVFGLEFTASGWAAETWIWNGQDWSRVTAAGPQGYYTGAAYDPVRHEVVLVDTWSSETWTWSGTQWQKRTPSMEPFARVSPSVAFDPSSKTVILFGGNAPYGGGYLNDTWSWDGGNWTQLHPATIPPGREHATMASFGAKGGVLLIGGDNPALLADAWFWNGTSWASVQSAGVRYGAVATEIGNQIIMFGGWTGADPSNATNDLWSWDGNVWQKQ